jgi:hypothetical protein
MAKSGNGERGYRVYVQKATKSGFILSLVLRGKDLEGIPGRVIKREMNRKRAIRLAIELLRRCQDA